MSKEIPIIAIQMDKTRRLKLDGNAFMNIEEHTGKNSFNGEIWQNMSMKDVITIVWQGLLWEDPDLTREKVASMFHAGVMMYWIERIQAAWVDAIDVEVDKDSPLATAPPQQKTKAQKK